MCINLSLSLYIYIYIYIYVSWTCEDDEIDKALEEAEEQWLPDEEKKDLGRGDDTVGNPHRAQISQFGLFELVLSSKLDKQFPVEQFKATVSQATVPSPPLGPQGDDLLGPVPREADRGEPH